MSETTSYEWAPGMTSLSGTDGDAEAAARAMLFAGLQWLDQHPEAMVVFSGFREDGGYQEADSPEAVALKAAIASGAPDAPPAVHQAALLSCLYVRKHGWQAYVNAMTPQPPPEPQDEAPGEPEAPEAPEQEGPAS